MNGLRVKKASNGKSLRYLIVEDGIPIPDVCLWLDLMSMNSYLTGERYAYSMLRYLRYLKEIGIHYKEVTKKGVIEEYVKNLLGMRGVVVSIESPITFS
ncbi:tyrosine-type recombinase/integrase, partial [Bacillus cereus group sp. BceL004]